MLRALILPDLQVPLNDRPFTERLIKLARTVRPDKLIFIGDLSDSTEISKWVKGRPGEYTGNFQRACHQVADVVRRFRDAAPDAELSVQLGNHDTRIKEYLEQGAPALLGQDALRVESLFGITDVGGICHQKPYEFFPGVLAVHGHEESYSSVPGKYGLDAINRYGASVVYGHTHRPLLVTNSRGYDGRISTQFAMNVGHGMDTLKVDYLKSGHMNWCRAAGVVDYDTGSLFPQLILSLDGTFSFEGVKYD